MGGCRSGVSAPCAAVYLWEWGAQPAPCGIKQITGRVSAEGPRASAPRVRRATDTPARDLPTSAPALASAGLSPRARPGRGLPRCPVPRGWCPCSVGALSRLSRAGRLGCGDRVRHSGQPGVSGWESGGQRSPDGTERRALAVAVLPAGLWCLVSDRL